MKLLSALIDTGTEYFTESELRHAVNAGIITVIEDFPIDFFDLLLAELSSDRLAMRSLDQMGIIEIKARVEKFFDCNYSKFGGDADVTLDGKLGDREVVNCPDRLTCKHQCFLCKIPEKLTQQEVRVAIMIALGMMDAEICYNLDITQNTLRNHKNHIEEKIGQTGKIAIAVWAIKVGLVIIN